MNTPKKIPLLPSDLPKGQTQSVPQDGIPIPLEMGGSGGRTRRPFTLEWAAGFVDGEGCISLVKQRYNSQPARGITYKLGFCIVQNDLQVLQHFQQGLGIHSKIYPIKRLMGHNRQIYTLNYCGARALALIHRLQPYLVRKQLEAQAALDYWVEGKGGQRPKSAYQSTKWPQEVMDIRERYFQKLKALK